MLMGTVGIQSTLIFIRSSISALVSAVNRLLEAEDIGQEREERLIRIMQYIRENYRDVTLEALAEQFHLSGPYLSKYIKNRAGMTFQEAVRAVRLKKAASALVKTGQTVEAVAESVGYESVEHFNRLFKKTYGMTPVQYRNRESERR